MKAFARCVPTYHTISIAEQDPPDSAFQNKTRLLSAPCGPIFMLDLLVSLSCGSASYTSLRGSQAENCVKKRIYAVKNSLRTHIKTLQKSDERRIKKPHLTASHSSMLIMCLLTTASAFKSVPPTNIARFDTFGARARPVTSCLRRSFTQVEGVK